MSDDNRLEYWSGKWSQGNTRWQLSRVNFALENHSSRLLPRPQCRVLVPLCGKSVDLEWLYRQGHTVVGIEGVEKAVVDFFTEHNLHYQAQQLPWAKVFKTADDRLKIYCCDIFKMDLDALGKFDAVWDRGSLVAIYEEDRERYAQVIKSLLNDKFQYMINIIQYTPNEKFSGPPRNIPVDLVMKLFGDVCSLEVLQSVVRSQEEVFHWHLESLTEMVLLLTPRQRL